MLDRNALKEFVKNNPDVPTKEIAEKFECTRQNVWTARHAVGVAKKSTMPKKRGLKVVRKSTLIDKDNEIKRLTEELDAANKINKELHKNSQKPDTGKDWESEYNLAVLHIHKLERLLEERKVVLGYLEYQLFRRSGNDNGDAV